MLEARRLEYYKDQNADPESLLMQDFCLKENGRVIRTQDTVVPQQIVCYANDGGISFTLADDAAYDAYRTKIAETGLSFEEKERPGNRPGVIEVNATPEKMLEVLPRPDIATLLPLEGIDYMRQWAERQKALAASGPTRRFASRQP